MCISLHGAASMRSDVGYIAFMGTEEPLHNAQLTIDVTHNRKIMNYVWFNCTVSPIL